MMLTDEQRAMIERDGSFMQNACAGSGKTTTALALMQKRDSRGLYLAFNKANVEDVKNKMKAGNSALTIHGLAFGHYARSGKFTFKNIGNLTNQMIENAFPAGLVLSGLPLNQFARSIRQQLEDFCKTAESEKTFFKEDKIYNENDEWKDFLNELRAFKLPVTHDMYLKFFAESEIPIKYDYVINDESQDCNPVMLQIFENQDIDKIYIGDSFQSIYGFRGSVNVFEVLDHPVYNLSNSFRINSDTAKLANMIAAHRSLLTPTKYTMCKGLGTKTNIENHCYISRTNYGVFEKILDLKGQCSVVGGYDWNQVFMDLWDVAHLGTQHVKQAKFKFFTSLDALQGYIQSTDDFEHAASVQFVSTHGKAGISSLKGYVDVSLKYKGDIYVSNAHRSKGLEFDEVTVHPDIFDSFKKGISKATDLKPYQMIEAIHLFYVTVTRARVKVNLGKTNFLKDYPPNVLDNLFI